MNISSESSQFYYVEEELFCLVKLSDFNRSTILRNVKT